MRRLILIASALLFISLLGVAWIESKRLQPVALTPTLTGEAEYCLSCHMDLTEISPSHPVKTFGCVICHGGERLALDADLAHSTMRGGSNPSDFSVVQASCGGESCHSGSTVDSRDHIQRATTSIQATYAGAIANIRYTFGAQPDLMARFGVVALQVPQSTSGITDLAAFDPNIESNPNLRRFGEACLSCHLSAPSVAGAKYPRFTGCSACHSPTSQISPSSGLSKNGTGMSGIHKLTTAISYTQCDACHNRGNYNLRSMEYELRQDLPTDRLHDYYQPIAQFTSCEWILDCVDCHTRTEVMGDGNLYSNQKDIQYVQCKTCHGTPTDLPATRLLTDMNDLAFRLALLDPVIDLQVGDVILIIG